MITKILHQIWNQRRHNAWIFVELFFVSLFLWMIVDPLYVIYAKKSIPGGYDNENRYIISVTIDEGQISDRDLKYNLVNEIINMPEVENSIIPFQASTPESSAIITDLLHNEEDKGKHAIVYVFHYRWLGNRNMFATLGIKDANSDNILTVPENYKGDDSQIFISKSAAMQLYGTTDVIGRKPKEETEIIGVYEDYKSVSYMEPLPSVIYLLPGVGMLDIYLNKIVKLKEGSKAENFIRRVNDLSEKKDYENIKEIRIETLDGYRKKTETYAMAANTVRQKFIYGAFAILCIFLCITGTFWVRMDNRRGDIGIMCSIGASRNRVVRQYVTEAIILLTLAFLAGLPFILHYVHISGFAEPSVCALPIGFVPNPEYIVNNFYIHFALVTAITYAALMLVTVLSTLIPVLRATRIQPADALREE